MATFYSFLFLFLISLIFCFSLYKMISKESDDEFGENLCMMTYMWRRMHFMDIGLEHPHYSLILYGEGQYAQKFAEKKKLDGIPLLFVPGNAGSERQVRSLGSVLQNKTEQRGTPFHFDPFAVDFNEELTALDFDQIITQSDFLLDAIDKIWALYKNKPPNGIVLIGHSMGGIIIQAALLNRKRIDYTKIAFVLSFATPYAEAPFQFDKRFLAFWKQMHLANIPVKMISIGGGIKDEFIDESWTKAPFLGAHSFTAAIDNVWLDMDHRCILWCNQLVRQTSRLLFDYALDPSHFQEQFEDITKKHYQSIGIRFNAFSDDKNEDYEGKSEMKNNVIHIDNANGKLAGNYLIAIAEDSGINPAHQLITIEKCKGLDGQTRYLDKMHFFAFLNLSNCDINSTVKILKHAQFWILEEKEISKTPIHLDFTRILFNRQQTIFSFPSTPFSVIPLVFQDGDFLIYRISVKMKTDNCQHESQQRVFFLMNDKIRRANEIGMTSNAHNSKKASILVYSSPAGNGTEMYKLIIVDARNCSEYSMEISIDFKNSFIRAFRRNRHILPAITVVLLTIPSVLTYANSLIAYVSPLAIAYLFHSQQSNYYDMAFVIMADSFLLSSFYLLFTCIVRPLLNINTNIETMSCNWLHLMLIAFSIYSGQTSIMALFFAFKNIWSINKKYEHDIIAASLSALQLLQASFQAPFLVTYFWRMIKYGEWQRSTMDPFFESNYVQTATYFHSNFIPMQSSNGRAFGLFHYYPIKTLLCSTLAILVFYRNCLCLFVLDDLTLLTSLFLTNFI